MVKKILIKCCPLCGNNKPHILSKKFFILKNLDIELSQTYSICPKCFFVFTKDPLQEKFLAKYYEANTQERRAKPSKKESEYMRDQLKFVRDTLSIINISVLEIGANNGSFVEQYGKYGATQMFYSEINKESLSILAKKKHLSNFDLLGDKRKKGLLDHIILLHTLEHIVNPKSFIKKLSTSLKDGGTFFIEVPDFTFYDDDTDELFFEHVNFFSESTLHNMFRDIGLNIISSKITLNRDYPACPKRVVRVIAQKSSLSPKKISQYLNVYRKKDLKKEKAFKNIESYIKSLSHNSKLVIYAASWLTIECLKNVKSLGERTCAIFDRDKKKQCTKIEGIQIYDPEELSTFDFDRIIILNEGHEKEIFQYLVTNGFKQKQVKKWSDFYQKN